MMGPQGGPGPRLQIQGERTSGQDVRTQNVTAVTAIANIVKSSLGPVGLDKVCFLGRGPTLSLIGLCLLQMLVDDIGDVTITNDGATILKQLEIQHPAAKVGRTPSRQARRAAIPMSLDLAS